MQRADAQIEGRNWLALHRRRRRATVLAIAGIAVWGFAVSFSAYVSWNAWKTESNFAIGMGLYYFSISADDFKQPEFGFSKHVFQPSPSLDFGLRPPEINPRLTDNSTFVSLVVPGWLPMLLFAAYGYLAERRSRKAPAAICMRCGYDLRGNTTGRCPECGTRSAFAPATDLRSEACPPPEHLHW